jgi:hypothetical protein
MEKLQQIVSKWFINCDSFTEDDPGHALRSAAHALYEAGELTKAEHVRITLSLFK